MDVIEKAKKGWQHWQLFKEIKPGHRFQTRYNNHRQRRERGETSTWRMGRGIKGLWTGLPAVVKALAALTFVVAVGYVAYYLFFG